MDAQFPQAVSVGLYNARLNVALAPTAKPECARQQYVGAASSTMKIIRR